EAVVVATRPRPRGALQSRVRIVNLVDVVVVGSSVELVRPRLHGHQEHSAARLPVFSREVAGLHREFLYGIDAGLILRYRREPGVVGRVLSFHPDAFRVRRRTVDANNVIANVVRPRNKLRNSECGANSAISGESGTDPQHRKRIQRLTGYAMS